MHPENFENASKSFSSGGRSSLFNGIVSEAVSDASSPGAIESPVVPELFESAPTGTKVDLIAVTSSGVIT
jgi:hypothetical protein